MKGERGREVESERDGRPRREGLEGSGTFSFPEKPALCFEAYTSKVRAQPIESFGLSFQLALPSQYKHCSSVRNIRYATL